MQLIETTIYSTKERLIDADVSQYHLAVLKKGRGEAIVEIDEQDMLSVSSEASMIRLVGNGFVVYGGQELTFYTLAGVREKTVTVGRHVFDLIPLKESVLCTYTDQGVFDDPIGCERIVQVYPDGTLMSHFDFAVKYDLTYEISFTRANGYMTYSSEANQLLSVDEQLQLQQVTQSPFELGNVFAIGYQYPYTLFLEEQRLIVWDGARNKPLAGEFSMSMRNSMHRGPYVFLQVTAKKIIGYMFVQ